MPRFFVDNVNGDFITLDGENAKHISRSLRMKIGDIITVSDGSANDYGCEIENISSDTVNLKVLYSQPSEVEPTVKVTLYQGVPKGDKMEDIIQKCVEIGVSKIVPVLTHRSVSRPDEKSAKKKNDRYQKIALEAAKQSGRGIVPTVEPMISFKTAVENANEKIKILFYEGGGKPLTQIIDKNIKSAAVFIGPEGGFEKEEVDLILEKGGINVTLGKRILRTQTAPVAALSAIMLLTGNLE